VAWHHLTSLSIFDMREQRLRVRVVGVERLNSHGTQFWEMDERTRKALAFDSAVLHVAAQIYHGGVPLGDEKPRRTRDIAKSANPRWGDWLEFDLSLSNVPRGARLCFTLYADGEAIGWVNMQLFDFQHRLLAGAHSAALWANGAGESDRHVRAEHDAGGADARGLLRHVRAAGRLSDAQRVRDVPAGAGGRHSRQRAAAGADRQGPAVPADERRPARCCGRRARSRTRCRR
jgi:hypothetical protein